MDDKLFPFGHLLTCDRGEARILQINLIGPRCEEKLRSPNSPAVLVLVVRYLVYWYVLLARSKIP